MIHGYVFDLDGTLVQTERLKAVSYARAKVELCPYPVTAEEVIAAFKDVVGLPRRDMALSLVEKFDLEDQARQRQDEFGVETAWQAFVQVRLGYYRQMMADPQMIRENQWPHTMSLLKRARKENCQVALATMSGCSQTQRVLDILQLNDAFDFIATRDDVERGKPDPEIYLLVIRELHLDPNKVVAIEDSPSGVEAALSAGLLVVAVATPFTRSRLFSSGLLSKEHIAEHPQQLETVLAHIAAQEG